MSKNKETLDDFQKYCDLNPDLRFWQALLSWSGQSFILFSNTSSSYLDVIHERIGYKAGIEDTFYREGK